MYLIDLYNYKPPEELRVVRDECHKLRVAAANSSLEFRRNIYNTDSTEEALDLLDFNYKIMLKSGLSDNGTYLPKAIHPVYNCESPITHLAAGMEECRMVVCGAMEGLMKRAGLAPKDVDILITTCSIFCPTPSMASMVINAFKLRPNIQAYHLGGMGCSNGVVAVNMVKDMLKAHPNSNAVLITTEVTTPAFYKGKDKHRQVTNMIFRTGASAMLFSNKPNQVRHAKYKLLHNIRVHAGSTNTAYSCIWFGPDEEGNNGIYLGKDVVKEASKALTEAMWKVGPKVLTWTQIASYAVNQAQRAIYGKKSVAAYKPRFTECLQHFLIHAGGAKVLDGIGAELQLTEKAMEPSRAVLYDYGNVSSSTTWYTLGWVESVKGVRKGDKILQIGVGSGIKCGVNVWQAVRDVRDVQDAWAHRAPDSDVLRDQRRGGSNQLGLLLLLLAVLVVLAAYMFHFAQAARLL
eukprot:jgi/Chrzof1/533/Cz01g19090.t1_LCKAS2